MRRRALLGGAVATVLLGCGFIAPSSAMASPALAGAAAGTSPYPECAGVGIVPEQASGPRITHVTVDGHPASVLLPPGYNQGKKRYPVLYLLHGGGDSVDHFLADTDLVKVTAALPPGRQYLVVTPFGDFAGFYSDWQDGSHEYGLPYLKDVIATVDRTFRTKDDRADRAIAGASMGGYGAVRYAEQDPGLFSAVASFSGAVNTQEPDTSQLLGEVVYAQRHCIDGVPFGQFDPNGLFGDPVTDAASWTAANPAANAADLKTINDVYVSSTTGIACNSTDAANPGALATEGIAYRNGQAFNQALTTAGVRHAYLVLPCGSHTLPYFNAQLTIYLLRLATFWPRG
jgi:diacylglycerol O-acyltransferase/trehalose O-mycolyltransferase